MPFMDIDAILGTTKKGLIGRIMLLILICIFFLPIGIVLAFVYLQAVIWRIAYTIINHFRNK